AAMRSGAGMVRLGIPGVAPGSVFLEVVGRSIPASGWADAVLADAERVKAMVVGPGLGRTGSTRDDVRRLLSRSPVPTLVDADGLYALGAVDEAAGVLGGRAVGTVLTPHDGEFRRLAGSAPSADRLG